jgi:hypothetical protein
VLVLQAAAHSLEEGRGVEVSEMLELLNES